MINMWLGVNNCTNNWARQWYYISSTVVQKSLKLLYPKQWCPYYTAICRARTIPTLKSRWPDPLLRLQHASLLMIPKVLIETNRCHWTSCLVAICTIYDVTMFSDIFNTDTIANYISEMKDYPIVLAWYWAESSEPAP